MNVIQLLEQLAEAARTDPSLKQRLLASEAARDPMDTFCKTAQTAGFPIYLGELFAAGEEFSDLQCKSTNGGNPRPYQYFNDAYGAFIESLK
ncbi:MULTISPECIES: hypothetical protein [Anaerotruncus]|uniref:hypothetical protein n=1 Tax=Anaerotruncus TaxID=244127 RepID=UPI00082FE305|nr:MULTISPECIES: hypothetical protein [Anaerotruncus]RGX54292.1 hypothetical protein DWV16_14930 [Anaerotruncus sp. AF02-27]